MENSVTQIGSFSYFPHRIVGKGSTGSVYQGFRNADKLPVAVKAIKLKYIDTQAKKHLLNCEVSALRTVKNRFVCQAYDVLKDSQFYYIPQEYCPKGTLRDYIKSKGKLNQNEALSMFSKILEGYSSIREAGFLHRDLKTENILLRENYEPVIIDFGYCENANTQNRQIKYNVGTPAYMSPESFNNNIYSQKSDTWSLGVVLHEMLTGTIPIIRSNDIKEYFGYLKDMKYAEIVQPQQNSVCTEILLRALTVDVKSRYSAKQLANFLTNYSKNIPFRINTNSYNIQAISVEAKNKKISEVPLKRSFELGYSVQNFTNPQEGNKLMNWNQKLVGLNNANYNKSQSTHLANSQTIQPQSSSYQQRQRLDSIFKYTPNNNCVIPKYPQNQVYGQRPVNRNLMRPPYLNGSFVRA